MATGHREVDGADAVDLDARLDGGGADRDGGDAAAPGRRQRRSLTHRLLTRWPDAVPAWARGPAAALVLVLAASALGAVAGSAHRGARDAQLALARGMSVRYTFVAGQDERSGRLHVDLRVGLTNAGDQEVSVGVRGLTTPHQATTGTPDDVLLEGGSTVAAPVALEVDCAAFGGGATATAEVTSVLAAVRPVAGGAAIDVAMPVPQDEADVLSAQLAARCGAGSDAAGAGGHSFLG